MPPSYPPSPLRLCPKNLTSPWHRSTETFVWLRVSSSVSQPLKPPFTNGNSTHVVPSSTPGSAASALSAVEATIFVHEFINIFRFSHRAVVHPADIHVIDTIDDDSARYDEENDTVFLSKDVMERFSKLMGHRPIRQSRARRSSRTLPIPAPPVAHFSYPMR